MVANFKNFASRFEEAMVNGGLRKALALAIVLCLCGAYFVAAPVQHAQAIGIAVGILWGMSLVAAFLLGYVAAPGSVHEQAKAAVAGAAYCPPAVEVNDYLAQYGWTLDTQLGAVAMDVKHHADLLPATAYYFGRKAQYVAQYFVNESSFPTDKVLTQAGVYRELANITYALMHTVEDIATMANVTVQGWQGGGEGLAGSDIVMHPGGLAPGGDQQIWQGYTETHKWSVESKGLSFAAYSAKS